MSHIQINVPHVLCFVLVHKGDIVVEVIGIIDKENEGIKAVVRVFKEIVELKSSEESINKVIFISLGEWLS